MEGFVLKLVDRHHVAMSREPKRHLKAYLTILELSGIFYLNLETIFCTAELLFEIAEFIFF